MEFSIKINTNETNVNLTSRSVFTARNLQGEASSNNLLTITYVLLSGINIQCLGVLRKEQNMNFIFLSR